MRRGISNIFILVLFVQVSGCYQMNLCDDRIFYWILERDIQSIKQSKTSMNCYSSAKFKENTGAFQTPLIFAVNKDDTELIKLLIDKGADINQRNFYKETAIIMAAGGGNIDVVRLLLSYKPDLDLLDREHKSALYYAQEKNYKDIVLLLEAQKAEK